MSQFRTETEHLIPAKFAGFKLLPMGIERTLFRAEIKLSILDLPGRVK